MSEPARVTECHNQETDGGVSSVELGRSQQRIAGHRIARIPITNQIARRTQRATVKSRGRWPRPNVTMYS